LPDHHEILQTQRNIMRSDFSSFVQQAFLTTNPGQAYLPNWHIDMIAEYLEAARHGHIRRLIFNMPPRSLKSHCITVSWPAFILGHDPGARIIAASYASALSLKHAQDTRIVMQSDWYSRVFPYTKIQSGENQKHRFVTSQRGFRLAVSVGGSVTGDGGDFLIVDDPLHPIQAIGYKTRCIANRWFDYTFSTRLNDKNKGVIVLVMQRLHPDDLTGHLIKKGGWEHVVIPAVSPTTTTYIFGSFSYERKEYELLHMDRENESAIERAKNDLGPIAYAAQYQQAPLDEAGALIKRNHFPRYTQSPATFERTIQSWDTAIKSAAQNDASAGITFGLSEGKWYVVDVQCVRMEYPELKKCIIEKAKEYEADTILIEDKASGQSLLQDLRREHVLPVVAIKPKLDKLLRFSMITSYIVSGMIVLPQHSQWLAAFETELIEFPNGKHDDQVDALSQFLHWFREEGYRKPTMRSL